MWIEWMMKPKSPEARLRDYDRTMLRSAFVSIFWNAITERRRREKFTLQELARRVGTNKSAASRWFSGSLPNWTLDTVADIAGALDLDLRIEALDRKTGDAVSPHEVQHRTVFRSASQNQGPHTTTARPAARPIQQYVTFAEEYGVRTSTH